MDVTMVAYYGTKTGGLGEFLANLQHRLSNCLGEAFERYELEQVHGTIVGLEGKRAGDQVFNTNYLNAHRRLLPMDLGVVFTGVVQESRLLPLRIRVGGFTPEAQYPFDSRGMHPFLRSFSIQGEIAVAMGWPVDGNVFTLSLDRLRRAFISANVLHKYHNSDVDVDNDLFFVLGRIDRTSTKDQTVKDVEHVMRRHLADIEPITFELRQDQISIIAYKDSTLPVQGSRVYTLEVAYRRMDEIKALYDELDVDTARLANDVSR